MTPTQSYVQPCLEKRRQVFPAPLFLLLLGSAYNSGLSPQRCAAQDVTFSSLFFKVLMQMSQWLENPAVEEGPLRTQLKSFTVQYSARHKINDGRSCSRPWELGNPYFVCYWDLYPAFLPNGEPKAGNNILSNIIA